MIAKLLFNIHHVHVVPQVLDAQALQKLLLVIAVIQRKSCTTNLRLYCSVWDFAKHTILILFLAHLSRRLRGELIVYRSSRRLCVRASVCPSVCSHFQT